MRCFLMLKPPTRQQIEKSIKFLEGQLKKGLKDPQKQIAEGYIKRYKELLIKLDKGYHLSNQDVKIWLD